MNSPVLDKITLESGAHKTRANGVCAMEAVAWLAGENHTDHPKCACPVIAQVVRLWNDALSNEDRQRLLKPLLPLLVGSKSTAQVEEQRGFMVLDWLIRVNAPTWLRLTPQLTADAKALSALPPITDLEAATEAGVVVRAAEKRVDDVWDAAKAAWVAAGFAAIAAARVTAGFAAMAAAKAATGAAAEAAAEDAAGDIAWAGAEIAAWAATGNAVRIATENAAWAAAKDALRPTVVELQDSCADLIQRMAAIR